jgi:hypothetical protein
LFWSLTPRQLQIHFEAASRRLERDQRARAWLAWHTAAMYRAEKMPRLEELWSAQPRPTVQPLAEMRANAILFTQLLGGEVRRRGDNDA